jgi:hypothetical protein
MYDHAVATIAQCVQAQEKPWFGNLFIRLASIYLCPFQSDNSLKIQRVLILTETGVVAQGSLNGFWAELILTDANEYILYLQLRWKVLIVFHSIIMDHNPYIFFDNNEN